MARGRLLDWLMPKRTPSGPPVDILASEIGEVGKTEAPWFLVDLRDMSAFRKGHIKGSHLIPYLELTRRMHEIPKNCMVVTVDTSERRGRQAAKLLRGDGYNARNLKGGIGGWPGKLVK